MNEAVSEWRRRRIGLCCLSVTWPVEAHSRQTEVAAALLISHGTSTQTLTMDDDGARRATICQALA